MFVRLTLWAIAMLIGLGVFNRCVAQGVLYLRIETIEGTSTDADHLDWLDIGSLGFGVTRALSSGGSSGSGRTVGQTTLSEITVTRLTDSASPLLAREAAAGKAKEVELELVRSNTDRRRYYRLRLKNALISSYVQASGGDIPTEAVTFNFTRLDLTYTDFGSKEAKDTTAWFDMSNQTGGVTIGNTPNTAPVVSNFQNTNTLEDTAITIPFTASDNESPVLGYSAMTSDAARLPLANITFGGTGMNRTVRLLPGTNQTGTVDVTVVVSDGTVSVNRTFTLTINPVNDAPQISAIPAQTTVSNTPITIPISIGDPDNAAGTLTVKAHYTGTGVAPSFAHGGSDELRSLTISPPADYVGPLPITVVVSDGTLSTSNSFTLNVILPEEANQAPSLVFAGSAPVAAIAGRWVAIHGLQAADPDAGNNAMSLHIAANGALSISNAAGLSISNNGGSAVLVTGTMTALNAMLMASNGVNYRAAAGISGTDTIAFTINDQGATGSGGPLQAEAAVPVRIYRSGLEQWQHQNFTPAELANPALEGSLWGANADPDGDHLENLAEYGLGTDARSAAHARPVAEQISVSGASFLSIEIAKRRDPDLHLAVMVASEVADGSWSGDAAAVMVSTPVDLHNGFESIRYTDATPVSNQSKRFMRMRWSLTVPQ